MTSRDIELERKKLLEEEQILDDQARLEKLRERVRKKRPKSLLQSWIDYFTK